MIILSRTLRILLVAFVLFGCAIFQPTPTSQPPADATIVAPTSAPTAVPQEPTAVPPTVTQPAPTAPALTEDMLKNFTYALPYTPDSRIPLQNGQFVMNQDNPPVKVFSRLMTTAFGDLNGDGAEDALAILGTNTGGSGTFFDLIALLNQNGSPLQIASTNFGDRQLVKDLHIEDGRIILDYMTQGPNDGACCPSQHNLRTYVLEGGLLSLTSEQLLDSEAAQATPLPNRIIIDRPQENEQILGNIFEVRGRVSQTPASGTLSYAITDINHTLIQQGSAPVSGTPGSLGSFTFQITLDPSVKYIAWIEVADAENGVLLGRTSAVVILASQ